MPSRSILVTAALTLLILAAPPGQRAASAGLQIYRWSPIAGFGVEFPTPDSHRTPYTAAGAELIIGYDPDNLLSSFASVTGMPEDLSFQGTDLFVSVTG